MANFGKGITVASGFDLAGNPVDSKYIVASLAEARQFITDGVAFEGMQVFNQEDKVIYVLVNGAWQTMNASSGAVDVDLSPYATLESPTFTGVPKAPTAEAGTETTQVATTAFAAAVAKSEAAAAAGTAKEEAIAAIPTNVGAFTNDADYATKTEVSDAVGAVKEEIENAAAGTYAPIASPALTGVPTAPTAEAGTETTQIATTAFAAAVAKAEAATAKEEAIAEIPVKVSELENDADYATKTEAANAASTAKEEAIAAIPTKVSAFENDSDFATKTEAEEAAKAAEEAAKAAIPTVISAFTNDADYATNDEVTEAVNAAKEAVQAVIPTKVSAFENDADYATKTEVGTAKEEAIAAIPEVVSAFTNDANYVSSNVTSTDAHVVVFDGTTGKLIKDSGFTIRASVPADAVFTDTTYELEDFGIEATAEEINYVKGVKSAIQGQIDSKADEGHDHDADYLAIDANAVSASKLAEAKNIALTGDATGSASFDGSADATIAVTLANSGVTAGTYQKVTVDAKGRVTAGSALEASDIPELTLAKITDAGTAAAKSVGTAAGNVPVLGDNGKLDTAILPAIAITDTFVVADEAAMLAVDAQVGDIVVRTDLNKTFVLQKDGASVVDNWVALASPTDSGYVSAVNGKTGAVTLTTTDIAEGDNLYYTEARATANFESNIAVTNVAALVDGAHVVLDTDEIIIDCGGAA